MHARPEQIAKSCRLLLLMLIGSTGAPGVAQTAAPAPACRAADVTYTCFNLFERFNGTQRLTVDRFQTKQIWSLCNYDPTGRLPADPIRTAGRQGVMDGSRKIIGSGYKYCPAEVPAQALEALRVRNFVIPQ